MKTSAPLIAAACLAVLAALPLGPLTGALAQEEDCLAPRQAQEAKQSGQILDLPQIYQQNNYQPSDVVSAQVCRRDGALYYKLSVYQGANADTVWINAQTGTP